MSDKPYPDQRNRIVAAVKEVLQDLKTVPDLPREEGLQKLEDATVLFEVIKQKAETSLQSMAILKAHIEEHVE